MLAIQKVGNDFHVKSLDGELLAVFNNKTIFTIIKSKYWQLHNRAIQFSININKILNKVVNTNAI